MTTYSIQLDEQGREVDPKSTPSGRDSFDRFTVRDVNAENEAARAVAATIGTGNAETKNRTRQTEQALAQQEETARRATRAAELSTEALDRGDHAAAKQFAADANRLNAQAALEAELIFDRCNLNSLVDKVNPSPESNRTAKLQAELDQQVADGVWDDES